MLYDLLVAVLDPLPTPNVSHSQPNWGFRFHPGSAIDVVFEKELLEPWPSANVAVFQGDEHGFARECR